MVAHVLPAFRDGEERPGVQGQPQIHNFKASRGYIRSGVHHSNRKVIRRGTFVIKKLSSGVLFLKPSRIVLYNYTALQSMTVRFSVTESCFC